MISQGPRQVSSFFKTVFSPVDKHKFIYDCCHQVHRAVACVFEGSAIIASHSCSSCHAGCLAFSFLGGSIEALTRSVSLYSCCLFSLRREALTFFDRPPRMLTSGRQASLSLSRSLFNSLSFPFSQFFHWLLVSLPLSLSIYQSRLLSQLLRWHVSER